MLVDPILPLHGILNIRQKKLSENKKVLWEKFTHTGRRRLSIVARDYNRDIKNDFISL